jgi:MurNAc alpha-1-phosphate uridylyltransferase
MNTMPPIAVIAGGLGTRLYPITKTIPKSLVSVGGTPFINHQLRLFARRGLRKAVFCVGHMGEQIEAHLAEHGSQGVEVLFSHEGQVLRGTGGALCQALPLLGDEFLVTYGDSYLDIDYRAVVDAFHQSRSPALMTVFRNQDCWDRSNVEYDGNRIVVYDKKNRTPRMQHIDYGLLAMRSESFEGWQNRPTFDLAELLGPMATDNCLAGSEIHQRFYEVGSQAGIADLAEYLATRIVN